MTFREQEMLIDIGKTKNNYDKKKDLSVSIITGMSTWQKNAKRRKRRIQGSALDAKE